MIKLLILFITLGLTPCFSQNVNLKQVKCLVCRTIVDEFKYEVNKIDPSKEIEIGQYRLDSKGNTIQKKVPLSTSEVHLSELLDSICKKMEDYVRATYKSNGKLTLLKLMTDNGMNPLMNEVDIIQDGDLNKSLEYFCTDIINENEDAFIEVIIKKAKNAKSEICTEIGEYCEDFANDLVDEDDEYESKTSDEDKDHQEVKLEL